HRRGPWSESEDAYLMSLVNSQGALNWVRIASTLGSRTPKQCRERFHQNLKPTLNHDPITPEEGVIIERLVRELGKRWAEIARRLNGRSDNAVKNWWNGSQNRRKRSEKRKALAMPFDDRQEIQPRFPHHHPNISTPRTLPMPSLSRPMPAPLLSASLHNERYGATVETPLSSPLSNSPGSELAPSLMSDSGSYYSTSPASRVELPPLKMPSDGMPHYSPRSSVSPSDTKLPPFSQL
ncbi:Homeodomain-like protein, partial [Lasiosphaeria miniovina]